MALICDNKMKGWTPADADAVAAQSDPERTRFKALYRLLASFPVELLAIVAEYLPRLAVTQEGKIIEYQSMGDGVFVAWMPDACVGAIMKLDPFQFSAYYSVDEKSRTFTMANLELICCMTCLDDVSAGKWAIADHTAPFLATRPFVARLDHLGSYYHMLFGADPVTPLFTRECVARSRDAARYSVYDYPTLTQSSIDCCHVHDEFTFSTNIRISHSMIMTRGPRVFLRYSSTFAFFQAELHRYRGQWFDRYGNTDVKQFMFEDMAGNQHTFLDATLRADVGFKRLRLLLRLLQNFGSVQEMCLQCDRFFGIHGLTEVISTIGGIRTIDFARFVDMLLAM